MTEVVTVEGEPVLDGRSARAVRTRDAIVDACIALVEEGDVWPTGPRVATRASVSVRSVFQHFDDIEGLYRAVGERVEARFVEMRIRLADGLAPRARVDEVVRQRTDLLEALTPVRRASLLHASRSAVIRDLVQVGQEIGRREVAEVLAPELASVRALRGERAAQGVLWAADAVLSWPTWEHLRTTSGLGIDAARAVVADLLRGVLPDADGASS